MAVGPLKRSVFFDTISSCRSCFALLVRQGVGGRLTLLCCISGAVVVGGAREAAGVAAFSVAMPRP